MEYKYTYDAENRNNTRQYCVMGMGLRETNYRDFESFEKRIKSIKKKGLVLHNVHYGVESDTYYVSFITVEEQKKRDKYRLTCRPSDYLHFHFRNGKMICSIGGSIFEREIHPYEKGLWQMGIAYIEEEEKRLAKIRSEARKMY